MAKVYIVYDDGDAPSTLGEPWGDGECLYNDAGKMATVFFDKKSARVALSQTKKYAEKQKSEDFIALWKMDKWEIKEFELKEVKHE